MANIGVLAFSKYYNFLNNNLSFLLHDLGLNNPIPYLSILLPIGLSFHTFQAMSYTIGVYRGHQKAERHFGIYALYVMFYPQLVAGPIERPQNLLHQFREKYDFDYDRVAEGLKLMLWGFLKKLVIADRLAVYVNAAYNNPEQHSGFTFLLATFFFAIQIYCDFSGYSDIAIGAAKVMGFQLRTNFNRPYFSISISEFSTWFRDYLYISLGGNRVSIPRWYFNLLLVFLISGLWHGANWTYIIWGALNGFYLIFAIVTQNFREKINRLTRIQRLPRLNHLLQVLTTFALTCFAWIFFRANNVQNAFLVIKKIASFKGPFYLGNPAELIYSFLGISLVFLVEFKREYFKEALPVYTNRNWAFRYLSYAFLIILILLIGVFDGRQFIYFQF